eukprot:15449477-Alexandrium_andersonii.AAC.1
MNARTDSARTCDHQIQKVGDDHDVSPRALRALFETQRKPGRHSNPRWNCVVPCVCMRACASVYASAC